MPSTGSKALARDALAALEVLARLDGPPSPDELSVLRGWPGWGPLAPAFEQTADAWWQDLGSHIEQLVSEEAFEIASESVDTAFYTSQAIVDVVFDILGRTGFAEHARSGVRVLEPGCGSGRFMMRTPAGWNVSWTGVEKDPTSAAIAELLNPEAKILAAPLERVSLVDESFDAVIGNVPFSQTGVYDRASRRSSGSLHLYFLHRALEAVREGGYVVLVISRFALDGPGLASCLEDGRGTLVGGIRLPSGAFRTEGTDVVADILVVRKGEAPAGFAPKPLVRRSQGYETSEDPARVSPYWADHPDHVAGVMRRTGNWRNPLEVMPGDDQAADIARAVTCLSTDLEAVPFVPRTEPSPADLAAAVDDSGRPEGSFVIADGGEVARVVAGQLVAVPRASKELRLLIELRDAGKLLVELEADLDLPDEALEEPRARALALYEAYVERYGPLNRGTLHEGKIDPDTGSPALSWRRPTMGGFRSDPSCISVLALERYDMETAVAEPAAILLGRVNRRPRPVERVETPGEALSVCLGELGRLDLSRVAGLLGLSGPAKAAKALGELVYQDPDRGGQWVPARDYLAGNVRAKLRAAEQAVAADRAYERNVEVLKKVQPAELGPFEIDIHLGVPWVEPDDVSLFLREVVGGYPSVTRLELTASWKVGYYGAPPAATTTWGTPRLNAFALCEIALNGRTPVVYDEVLNRDGLTTRKVRNPEQTLAAAEKLAALDDRFGSWVWEDAERAERICARYNEAFSSHVIRQADGSHLSFPGLSAGIELWPWQRKMIDRILSGPTAFCAHNVGLGKTLTAVGAAVTLRRMGLVSKPMLVVPNHLLEQIAREAQQAFPLGRFLVAGRDDLAGDGRRLFAARCATGDWDAVILTHQGFTSIPMDSRFEQEWLREQKAAYAAYMRSEECDFQSSKEIARALRGLEARLLALRDGANDPDTVLFEQLGVDWIGVDEVSLAFRRLPIAGRAEGFSFGSSKRATDLLMKVRWLRKRQGDKPHVAFFSGTPWSNTLAETFVWQTYLQPDRLEDVGLAVFDAWAAAFVKRETRVEVAPDGSGFRTAMRPVGLRNLPELRTMLGEVMDILPADDVSIERPDAEVHNLVAEPSPGQQSYVRRLVHRADRIRRGGVERTEDNMLLVCTDGRKVALDPCLVGIEETSPKLDLLADKVAAIYEETKDRCYGESELPGSLQLVFCDLGTPGDKGSQTYGRIKQRLVAKGVPADKVRWIHEATTDKARAALFAACRSGAVSVLLASTEKAGLGTNVQTRLVAIHHADAPHRPSDMQQRDGRGIRPGNLNPVVQVVRYVTEGTFDAYMWQALERKARSFSHMFSADSAVREVDDLGEVVLSYGEVKALASGNPLLLQQAEAQAAVKRLRTMKAIDAQSVATALRSAARLKEVVAEGERRLAALRELQAQAGAMTPSACRGIASSLGQSAHRAARGSRGWLEPVWHTGTETKYAVSKGHRVVVLTISRQFEFLAAQSIPVGLLRNSLREATDEIDKTIGSFFAGLDNRIAELGAKLKDDKARIKEAEELAAGYSYSQEAELQEAELRLARINDEIAQSVEEPTDDEQAAA